MLTVTRAELDNCLSRIGAYRTPLNFHLTHITRMQPEVWGSRIRAKESPLRVWQV